MNFKIKFMLLIFAASTVFFSACNKTELPDDAELSTSKNTKWNNTEMFAAKTFSVVNMKKAYSKLGLKSDSINANAFYVKLIPATPEDIRLIESDTFNVIFDYPLDVSINVKGTGTVDTFLNPRYLIVDDVSQIPDMSYEIKDELYLPNTDEDGKAIVTAMILSGELEEPADKDTTEVIEENKAGWIPKLTIKVNNGTTDVPLQDMRIRIGLYYDRTDANGVVKNTRRHYGKIDVFGRFENNSVTVRKGLTEIAAIDRYDKIADDVSQSDYMRTLSIKKSSNESMWMKATCFEAIRRYNAYCVGNGIAQASNINLWITPVIGSRAAAPLFHVFDDISTTFFKSMAESFLVNSLSFTTTFIANLIGSHLEPDIVIGDFSTTMTGELLVFHELSHYSHAIKRGKTFWHNIVAGEISCMALADGDPYGDGTQPNATLASYIGLAESWANFMEATIGAHYSHGTSAEGFKPRTIPFSPSHGGIGWFPVGVYWDILDNSPTESEIRLLDSNNSVIVKGFDTFNGQGNGITVSSLYNLMTNSSCNSVTNFKTLFNQQYPTLTTQSNLLFSLYAY